MEPVIRIEMLGPLRVVVGDRVITRFSTQHAALLLAYMALSPDTTHSREMFIDKLWPETDLSAGRNRLSTALSSLRRQLEPPGTGGGSVIQANRFSVGLRPSAILTDVSDFREAARAATTAADPQEQISTLRHAIALYRGPFLDGLYAEWIDPERISFAGLFLHKIRRLLRLYALQGHYDQALACALRAVALDPLRQDLHRDVMHVYVLLGDVAAAARHYEDFARLLERDLGHAPSALLRELYRQLQSGSLIDRRNDSLPGVEETLKPTAPIAVNYGHATITDSLRLPVQLTRFFGREIEITRLHDLFRDKSKRLITLSGPAGSGKTRLALEVAGHIAAFSGAVCFVDLTALSDPQLLPSAIAQSLGLPLDPKADPMERVFGALQAQRPPDGRPQGRWLVVLDNFEHMLAHKKQATSLVHTLLERVPSLTCLITSRQLLGLLQEQDFPVHPLAVPSLNAGPSELMQMASVALFVDRAQMVLPDFQLNPRSAEKVAHICRRLEGIPLAIELAATRIKAIPIDRMLDQLQQRFDVLVSKRRGATARHRTLWAAVELSYILLPVEAQRFFCRLSVFRGGWTAEAAATVCDETEATGYLDLLCDASLVRNEEKPLGNRFRMLETLREFGWEQMSEEGRAEACRSHVNYFLRLAENAHSDNEALLKTRSSEPDRWLDILEIEHDNLRQALAFCMEDADGGEAGLQLGGALQQFWWMHGHLVEGLRRLTALLARPNAQKRVKARASALAGAAAMAWLMGDPVAASPLYRQSLEIWRELGARYNIAKALNNLGMFIHSCGDYAAAWSFQEESLEIFRELDDRHGIAWALSNLGNTAMEQRNLALAWSLQQESLASRRDMEDGIGVGISLNSLGAIAIIQGDTSSARSLLNESLEIRRQWGDWAGIIYSLEALADLNAADNIPELAARLWAAIERAREEMGFFLAYHDQDEYVRNVAAARLFLGEEAFAAAWAEGRAMTMEQAATLCLAIDGDVGASNRLPAPIPPR